MCNSTNGVTHYKIDVFFPSGKYGIQDGAQLCVVKLDNTPHCVDISPDLRVGQRGPATGDWATLSLH